MIKKLNSLTLLIWGSVALQLAKTVLIFQRIRFSEHLPILNIDFTQYYARALRTHEFLIHSGRFWGYDPFIMAGYPSGMIHELGSLFPSLICHWLSPLMPIWLSILLVEFFFMLLAPFFVLQLTRSLGFRPFQSWFAFLSTVLLYGNFHDQARMLAPVALFPFFTGCFFSLGYAGVFVSWIDQPTTPRWILFTAMSILMPIVYPITFLLVLPFLISFFFIQLKSIPPRVLGLLSISVAFTIASNLFWMRPYVHYHDWQIPVPYLVSPGLAGIIKELNPFRGLFFTSSGVLFKIAVIILSTRFFLGTSTKNPVRSASLIWVASIFIFGYYGSHIPLLRTTQPYRCAVFFWILLGIFAGLEIGEQWEGHNYLHSRIAWLAIIFSGVSLFSLVNRGQYTNKLSPQKKQVIEYLRLHGDSKTGRVLIECLDNEEHFLDLIPSLININLIGGPNPSVFLKSRFTVFIGTAGEGDKLVTDNPIIFNRPLININQKEFLRYLDLYNIHTVLARMPVSENFFDSFKDGLKKIDRAGDYAVYSVQQHSTWFYQGSGEVDFNYDRIDIHQASAGTLVLKTHWMEGLVADKNIHIYPVALLDDPVPFIGIDNHAAANEIIIQNQGMKAE